MLIFSKAKQDVARASRAGVQSSGAYAMLATILVSVAVSLAGPPTQASPTDRRGGDSPLPCGPSSSGRSVTSNTSISKRRVDGSRRFPTTPSFRHGSRKSGRQIDHIPGRLSYTVNPGRVQRPYRRVLWLTSEFIN